MEPALLADVERGVRQAGSLPLTKLTRAKLTKEARAELERRLVERGLERGAKAVRVPLEEQLLTLVSGGGRLSVSDAERRVKGAARAETKAAVDALVRKGKLRVVVRTKIEVLVGGAEQVLEPAEIAEIVRTHAQLGGVLRKVAAKGRPRTLLREDLAALLGPALRAVRGGVGKESDAKDTDAKESVGRDSDAKDTDARAIVDDALGRLEDPTLRLVRIPDLVRSLADRLGLDDIHQALADAASRGAIELRPEAGREFLSAEDARLCQPGPRDTVFSYARRLLP